MSSDLPLVIPESTVTRITPVLSARPLGQTPLYVPGSSVDRPVWLINDGAGGPLRPVYLPSLSSSEREGEPPISTSTREYVPINGDPPIKVTDRKVPCGLELAPLPGRAGRLGRLGYRKLECDQHNAAVVSGVSVERNLYDDGANGRTLESVVTPRVDVVTATDAPHAVGRPIPALEAMTPQDYLMDRADARATYETKTRLPVARVVQEEESDSGKETESDSGEETESDAEEEQEEDEGRARTGRLSLRRSLAAQRASRAHARKHGKRRARSSARRRGGQPVADTRVLGSGLDAASAIRPLARSAGGAPPSCNANSAQPTRQAGKGGDVYVLRRHGLAAQGREPDALIVPSSLSTDGLTTDGRYRVARFGYGPSQLGQSSSFGLAPTTYSYSYRSDVDGVGAADATLVESGGPTVYAWNSDGYGVPVSRGGIPYARMQEIGFPFTYRNKPLRFTEYPAYWRWLAKLDLELGQILGVASSSLYAHRADEQADTIGTLEAYVLAGIARASEANFLVNAAKLMADGARYKNLMTPTLRSIASVGAIVPWRDQFNRAGAIYAVRGDALPWGVKPLPRTPPTGDAAAESRGATLNAVVGLTGAITDQITEGRPFRTAVLPPHPAPTTIDDRVFTVRENELLALLGRLQYFGRVTVNLASTAVKAIVDDLLLEKNAANLSTQLSDYLRAFSNPLAEDTKDPAGGDTPLFFIPIRQPAALAVAAYVSPFYVPASYSTSTTDVVVSQRPRTIYQTVVNPPNITRFVAAGASTPALTGGTLPTSGGGTRPTGGTLPTSRGSSRSTGGTPPTSGGGTRPTAGGARPVAEHIRPVAGRAPAAAGGARVAPISKPAASLVTSLAGTSLPETRPQKVHVSAPRRADPLMAGTRGF